ncbi:MAG: ABC transporter ATP-binding protein [Polyangiales bacterium]
MSELRACGLWVQRGGRTVLGPLDLEARAGEVLAVLGPNGAGKSSLLGALAGALPCRGDIELGGQAWAMLSPAHRARLVSFVPQRSDLDAALRVAQVVAQGRYAHLGDLGRWRPEDHHAVARALSGAHCTALAQRNYLTLSVGEQRRVLIARALATEAPVLLLDEPDAALDVLHALHLYRLLRELAQAGRAIVVALHDLDTALTSADRVLLLHAGRMHALGAPSAVLTPAHIAAVYGVQLAEARGLRFKLPDTD